jgi:hypothetical protein
VTGDTLLNQVYWAMYQDIAYQLPVLAHLLSGLGAHVVGSTRASHTAWFR